VARRRYLSLLAVRLPLLLLLMAVAWFLPSLLIPEGAVLEGNQLRLIRYGTFALGVLLEMAFVYAPVVLVIESTSVLPALGRALRVLGRAPLATLLIVGVPNLAQIPVNWALRRADVVVQNLTPELVLALVVGTILVYVGINYFILASAVRIFGARGASREEAAPWKA
jgi:hypothetical protein